MGEIIRALRVELARPLGSTWEDVGPLLHRLRRLTPKLVNAAMDVRIAVDVVGAKAVKAAVAPDAKAGSPEGISYQGVLRQVDRLRNWKPKNKKEPPYADLNLPGGMMSQIARVANQAFARRDQGRQHFESDVILVRKQETKVSKDDKGVRLTVKIGGGRTRGTVSFGLRHSHGRHQDILERLASAQIEHGDCKLKWDERRRKWYGLIAYKQPVESSPALDASKVLAVHRGMRNAVYLLPGDGSAPRALPGFKFLAQRRMLQARLQQVRKISAFERGDGAKGHGVDRRMAAQESLDGKLGRVTHTFCQQVAAFVAATAIQRGCGKIVIEDFGGMEVDRFVGRFPWHELKQAIASRLEREGIEIVEGPAEYISQTCPNCERTDPASHNTRTGVFHCRVCQLDRPADFVASFWLLAHSGVDMTDRRRGFRSEIRMLMRGDSNDDGTKEENVHGHRGDHRGDEASPERPGACGASALPVPDGDRSRSHGRPEEGRV